MDDIDDDRRADPAAPPHALGAADDQIHSGLLDEPDPFDRAIEAAIAALPDAYRAQLATVAIVVADEASAEELAELGVAGLYGLYRGIPRTTLAADGMAIPSVITLYRGPLERAYRGERALIAGVEETLRHELAHHLGISDRRLHELKRR